MTSSDHNIGQPSAVQVHQYVSRRTVVGSLRYP